MRYLRSNKRKTSTINPRDFINYDQTSKFIETHQPATPKQLAAMRQSYENGIKDHFYFSKKSYKKSKKTKLKKH